ncbi:MAG: hypothetical protein HZB14_05085 [Actinobacteria bacterium]|nr:hypothetical protein [Actinomycetota bacterium]
MIDSDPPVVSRVKVRRLRTTGSESAASGYRLTVVARDSRSGVDHIEIRTSKNRKPLKRAYGRSHRVDLSTNAKRIRLRSIDRAGNASRWRTVQLAR